MFKIAVFASGSGTNAENLVKYFHRSNLARVDIILTNNTRAGVISRGKELGMSVEIFTKEMLNNSDSVLQLLKSRKIDFIILAGFLLLIPEPVLNAYDRKIINIHPALLPLHGGKGLYGSNVHKAVIDSHSLISGITIHYVNSNFDEGEIIFQAACSVDENESPESLSYKIHQLEQLYFPVVTEKILLNLG